MRKALLLVLAFLFSGSTFAQDSLATVFVYRLGAPELNVSLPLYVKGVLKGNLAAKSVLAVKCSTGANQFTNSLENETPFSIDVKPGGTYWMEYKLLDNPTFSHVTKEEARRDLAKINKYAPEQVKDDAIDPDPSNILRNPKQSIYDAPHTTLVYKIKVDNNNNGHTELTSAGITVIVKSNYKQPDKISITTLYINDEEFIIDFYKKENKARKDIINEEGQRLATIMDSGPLKNNIQMADGALYDFQKVNGSHWSYLLNGEVIAKGSVEMEGLRKTIQVEFLRETQSPTVFLACLSYGLDLIMIRKTVGGLVGASMLR